MLIFRWLDLGYALGSFLVKIVSNGMHKTINYMLSVPFKYIEFNSFYYGLTRALLKDSIMRNALKRSSRSSLNKMTHSTC